MYIPYLKHALLQGNANHHLSFQKAKITTKSP